MKKLFRIGLTTIALAFMLGMFAVTETRAQVLNEVLKRMDAHYKVLTSLQASVNYEKFESGLGDKTARQGKAVYLTSNGRNAFRIDWTKPNEILSVIDKRYVLYQLEIKQAIVGTTDDVKTNSSSSSNPLFFITMSKEQMRANYNIKYLGEEKVGGTISTWHLELTPKSTQKYKLADIWVDGNGMPVQMKITANNNDTESILLTNLDKNGKKIDTAIFKINLPKDVKVINK